MGRDVTRFKPGDHVYALHHTKFGSYAEYVCLRQDLLIGPRPSNLTSEEAAAIPYGGLLALHPPAPSDFTSSRLAVLQTPLTSVP